jgi:hypothetical protein
MSSPSSCDPPTDARPPPSGRASTSACGSNSLTVPGRSASTASPALPARGIGASASSASTTRPGRTARSRRGFTHTHNRATRSPCRRRTAIGSCPRQRPAPAVVRGDRQHAHAGHARPPGRHRLRPPCHRGPRRPLPRRPRAPRGATRPGAGTAERSPPPVVRGARRPGTRSGGRPSRRERPAPPGRPDRLPVRAAAVHAGGARRPAAPRLPAERIHYEVFGPDLWMGQ